MNCPEHLIFKSRFFTVWHHQRADVPRKYVTWKEVLNPFRYELLFGGVPPIFVINRNAWMRIKVSNFIFLLKQKWRRNHD